MGHFEREFASVEYNARDDVVVATLSEFAEGDRFRAYMDAIIEALVDENCDTIITDNREMGALSQEDQEWSVGDWAPRAEAAGLEHLALVMPESVVSKMSVENVTEMADDDIDREFFDNMGDARDWAQNL